ncbi:hypothetical protein N7532_005269 [Penicillium argentinense]|uniref:Uncharacterized protein n=1 Tax=Penicillium argentinense TaxID=1131581 RepID=A0A9W9FDK5_9EURO|nr:uncharacterized protein N7532_005269 [Penicillium argentinense]KAJ5098268.1 hypothetical protein N7532_005269 [Penicillium argentinense]
MRIQGPFYGAGGSPQAGLYIRRTVEAFENGALHAEIWAVIGAVATESPRSRLTQRGDAPDSAQRKYIWIGSTRLEVFHFMLRAGMSQGLLITMKE